MPLFYQNEQGKQIFVWHCTTDIILWPIWIGLLFAIINIIYNCKIYVFLRFLRLRGFPNGFTLTLGNNMHKLMNIIKCTTIYQSLGLLFSSSTSSRWQHSHIRFMQLEKWTLFNDEILILIWNIFILPKSQAMLFYCIYIFVAYLTIVFHNCASIKQ